MLIFGAQDSKGYVKVVCSYSVLCFQYCLLSKYFDKPIMSLDCVTTTGFLPFTTLGILEFFSIISPRLMLIPRLSPTFVLFIINNTKVGDRH